MNNNINLKEGVKLQNDNVIVNNSIESFADLIKMPVRKGFEQVVISEGEVVNVVSKSYGHLPNENFFLEVERKLIEADINYVTRSINRNNRSFAVDYILSDENLNVVVNDNIKDKIRPMLRFTNSYDGSNKTSGHFGYFREVCSNGLHIAETKLGFSIKHKGAICDFVLTEIDTIVNHFLSNEYYTIQNKFKVLGDKKISDVQRFVETVCEKTKLMKFAASDKNPAPSKNANIVIDTINNEANILGTQPNFWLGYNSFNEILHNGFEKTFEVQKNLDAMIFETVYEMAN
jgi:hypothetical protein